MKIRVFEMRETWPHNVNLFFIKIIIFIFFTNLFLMPKFALANAGWSGNAKIISMYTLNENMAILKLSTFSNPHSCLTGSQGDVFLNPSANKSWYSLLMAAFMANKTVDIYVKDSCTNIWSLSFADVYHVRVFQE